MLRLHTQCYSFNIRSAIPLSSRNPSLLPTPFPPPPEKPPNPTCLLFTPRPALWLKWKPNNQIYLHYSPQFKGTNPYLSQRVGVMVHHLYNVTASLPYILLTSYHFSSLIKPYPFIAIPLSQFYQLPQNYKYRAVNYVVIFSANSIVIKPVYQIPLCVETSQLSLTSHNYLFRHTEQLTVVPLYFIFYPKGPIPGDPGLRGMGIQRVQ